MDDESFFDRLYGEFHVHFPCYAVVLADGEGFATETAPDGSEALVLLTDDDLAERYLGDADGPFPVTLSGPGLLATLLGRLPPSIGHVTFDPGPWFHRRYPLDAIRAGLAAPVRKAG